MFLLLISLQHMTQCEKELWANEYFIKNEKKDLRDTHFSFYMDTLTLIQLVGGK